MRKLLVLLILCALSFPSLGAPGFQYTALTPSCTSGNRTLSGVMIFDLNGVPTSGANVPRIYYRKAGGTWFSQPGTLVTGNGFNGTWDFTIVATDLGSLSTGDVVQYYVVAQSVLPTTDMASQPSGASGTSVNNITTHPFSPNSYPVGLNLTGTYTVGTGGDFASLPAAIQAYNTGCPNGQVVFSLTDASYSLSSQLRIANSGASSTNTLTIRPAAGVSSVINSTFFGPAFKIVGSHITIDGDNGNGGRNLSISSANSIPVGIFSSGLPTVTNVNLRNVQLTGGTNAPYVVLVSDSLNFTSGANFSHVRIHNNSLRRAQTGVQILIASGAPGVAQGIEVTDNDLTATGADAILNTGIYLSGGDGGLIAGNGIANFNNSQDQDDVAISIGPFSIHTVIRNNRINNLGYSGNQGHGAQGIRINSQQANSGIRVFNNFIANLTGDGYNEAVYTANPVGIMLNGGQGGVTIAHNTVSLSGNTLYQTRSFSAGIYLASGSSATVQNNLISNLLGFAPGASTDNFGPLGALGLYAASGASQLTGISGNDYYVSPTGAGVKELGRLGNTGYTAVAAWQTASGEINAKNIQPVFVSATDLHLVPASNGSLDNTGSAGTITTDIDGDTRSATTPDPGADEFAGPCVAPAISAQPLAIASCIGTGANFTVTATGSSLTYQWRKGGNAIPGATAASYSIASVTAGDAANYDVVITGACGNLTSNAVALTVNTPPAITTQPVAQTLCLGGNASFTVAATGTGLTFQWRKNGSNINGANSATLTLNNTAATDAATYDVVVSGTCSPSVTSTGVALQFFAAPAITAQPSAQSLCPGAQANFSITATGQALTYQWKKDGSDLPGATSNNLDIANVSSANAGSYTVVVTNSCGQSVTSNAVSLTLLAVPVITVQPQNQLNICTGSTASFSVTATGSGLNYQWRKGGNNISGATNASYTIPSVTAGDAGNYDVVISGSCGSPITSNAASLSVNAPGLWCGTVSADWSDAQNWCGGVPTQTTDVVIPSGTAFSPAIGTGVSVRNLTINSGAALSLTGNNTLSIYGDLVNDGTVTAAATSTVAFRGAAAQNARGLVTAGGVVVNGAGVVLTNAASVGTSLVLTAGHLTLGNFNLILGESSTGSAVSHIVVNGSGKVTMKAVGTSPKQVPVGPDAASVNPVTITNGQGRDYTVSVASGISPAIADPSRAVNRTWTIMPSSAPGANVTLDFQFETAHANTNTNLSAVMEVGVHTGSVWAIASPTAGVTPQATGTTRTVSLATQFFGPTVISSPGGIAYPLSVPSVDPDLTEARLLPNLVHDIALLRLQLRRTMQIEAVITDAAGRVLHRHSTLQPAGTSDLRLSTTSLAAGAYYLQVHSAKGMRVLRFVKE